MMFARAALLLAIGSLGACSGANGGSSAVFSKHWQNDSGAAFAKLEEQLRSAKRIPNTRVAVGVTANGLVGIGLDGATRWAGQGKVDVLPVISANVVFTSGGGQLMARAAHNGKLLWKQATQNRTLYGAADDGNVSIVILGAPGSRTRVFTINHDGEIGLDFQTEETLGRPAALRGYAFVPWGSQYVSVIDMRNGAEAARLLMREQVSHAINFDGDLYFGELGLIRFDEQVRFATTHQAKRVSLPVRELPGKPLWLGSGTAPTPVTSSARAKIRVYARPTLAAGHVELASHGFAATYFRVAYGLEQKEAALSWVRTFPSDIVGGAAATSGFAFCDADGRVWLVSEHGGDAGKVELGDRFEVCVVSTGDQPIRASKPNKTLAEQIGGAFDVLEPDMAVAQRFLLTELDKLKDPIVTKTLIDLSSSPRIPPEQRDESRKMLAARRTGAEYMLTALERHYDFVSGVLLPPPVGPLADALAAMGEKAAAPLLAEHLNDPANAAEDVLHAAVALRALASNAQFEALRTFFALYRATADSAELVQAVIAVGAALVRIGGEPGRELVERAARDPLTHVEVRRGLSALLPTEEAKPEAVSNTAPAKTEASR